MISGVFFLGLRIVPEVVFVFLLLIVIEFLWRLQKMIRLVIENDHDLGAFLIHTASWDVPKFRVPWRPSPASRNQVDPAAIGFINRCLNARSFG